MKKRDVSHAPTTLRGFTLVELMVTVSIVAILMAIGVPQLLSFIKKQQVAADIESLTSALRLARSEALKRGGAVSVCPLAAGLPPACDKTAKATSWSNGWMVFIDYGVPGQYDLTKGDLLLKVEQTVRSGPISTGNKLQPYIAFWGNGISNTGMVTFAIGDKCLTVNPQGRTRVTTPNPPGC